MKAELRLAPHSQLLDHVVEVWFNGRMIATVYGGDGPGVRVISKFPLSAEVINDVIKVVEVKIDG